MLELKLKSMPFSSVMWTVYKEMLDQFDSDTLAMQAHRRFYFTDLE